MSLRKLFSVPITLLAVGALLWAGTLLPGSSAGAQGGAEFPQCPAIGRDTGCEVLLTINSDGTVTSAVDPRQPPLDGQDDTLVGVVNNSGVPVSGLDLTGSVDGNGIFDFDGEGLCVPVAGPGTSPPPNGCPFDAGPPGYMPTGYEGPGTWFSVKTPSNGVVEFAGSLASGSTSYFSLQDWLYDATISDLSISPVPVGTAVPVSTETGTSFNGPVATFTDAASGLTPSDFTASVDWGDGSALDNSTTITESDGTFTVDASHTYATAGSFTATVSITDENAVTTTVSSPVEVADVVVTCESGEQCSGTVTEGGQTTQVGGTSDSTGTLSVTIGADSLDCDDNYRHAPQMTTIDEVGLSGKGFTVLVSFAKSDAIGPSGAKFAVCFSSTVPFKDAQGNMVTTGDLRRCRAPDPSTRRPCLAFLVHALGQVTEKILIPPEDPRFW